MVDASTPRVDTPSDLNFRSPTEGEENDLVRNFLRAELPEARRGQVRTIFVEPAIETGYPDLVVAYWSLAVTRSWPLSRTQLEKQDLKLAHLLATGGPQSADRLNEIIGPTFDESLERALTADVVYRKGPRWYGRSLRRTFALRRLIAIEAKIGNWNRGAWQAVRNTWFASESYLLIPELTPSSGAAHEAAKIGIGLITPSMPLARPVVRPTAAGLPRSYASWLFNEWAWKMSLALE